MGSELDTGDIVTLSSISINGARRLIKITEQLAAERGIAVTVAVCDITGYLKAAHCMDGAVSLVEAASSKARTALMTYRPSGEWPGCPLEPPVGLSAVGANLVADGGGFPIAVRGKVVGAVGVSCGDEDTDVVIGKLAADRWMGI